LKAIIDRKQSLKDALRKEDKYSTRLFIYDLDNTFKSIVDKKDFEFNDEGLYRVIIKEGTKALRELFDTGDYLKFRAAILDLAHLINLHMIFDMSLSACNDCKKLVSKGHLNLFLKDGVFLCEDCFKKVREQSPEYKKWKEINLAN